MKVISISTDKNIFEEGSAVSERMKEYGNLFKELHIVVFSLRSRGYQKIQLSHNVWVYPTQSINKISQIWGAQRIAMSVLKKEKDMDNWVVSTQDPFETGIVGRYLQRKLGIRFNVQIHTDLYSPYFKTASLLNRIRLSMAPKVLKQADSIRVVSRKVKESLVVRGIPEDKIAILPIFVDRNLYDSFRDVPQKDSTVLAVSRLSEEKNLFFLIDVIDSVVEKGHDVVLYIVGDGPLNSALQEYVAKKSLEANVEFVGWKQDVGRWYRKASVFIHTSLFEGYGMALIEAALHHVPIVTSDVGIIGDVLLADKSALVAPVDDVEAFSKHLITLLTDRAYAQKISSAAYTAVSAHLLEDREHYLEAYKNAL